MWFGTRILFSLPIQVNEGGTHACHSTSKTFCILNIHEVWLGKVVMQFRRKTYLFNRIALECFLARCWRKESNRSMPTGFALATVLTTYVRVTH
jgi:hypothetical protein